MNHTIIQIDPDLFQIKVPLPYPLQWVNAYAARGTEGWTIIDPGLHTAQAEQRWEEAAQAIGMPWDSVSSIVLTHHHPDHYGMSGWFQERTGANVYASAEAERLARQLWGEEASATAEKILALFIRHGLSQDEIEPMRQHLYSFVALVSPQPSGIIHIAPGSLIYLGDIEYEAILTEGHAAGHLSFLDRSSGRMFCGDHVLPGITPNVSYQPDGDPDPLRTFLTALAEAERLPVTEALPGHRDAFKHFSQRCRAIIKHHDERLERMRELARTLPDAYSVCRAMFGNRLSVHQLRFALSETIAHLIYLEELDPSSL